MQYRIDEVEKMDIILDDIFKVRDTLMYAITMSDEKLLHVQGKLLTLDELVAEVDNISKPACDFKIEDGVLRCNPMITPIDIDDLLFQEMIAHNNCINSPGDNSLYKLLQLGVENDYVILGGDSSEAWERGEALTKFRNIKFSNSTMSVYARMRNVDGIFNKMIVVMTDGRLEFRPFKFAIPTTSLQYPTVGTKTAETLKINNVDYTVWETGILSIYDEVEISLGLVNQSLCDNKVYAECIKLLDDFLAGAFKIGNSEVEWAGGKNDYSTQYGVYFKTSCKGIGQVTRNELQRIVLEAKMAGKPVTDAMQEGMQYLERTTNKTRSTVFALKVFAGLIYKKDVQDELIREIFNMKTALTERIFWRSLYSYRVRTNAYLLKLQLTPMNMPMLYGGNTTEYATVQTNYIY